MNYESAGLWTVGLFLGMLIFLEIGRRIGLRRTAHDSEGARAGVNTIEAAIFALLGLLLAFTFSGASSRFDARRHLIIEETNAIGTAYLRIDMLPAAAQPPLRENFRRYVDARLEVYRRVPDMAAVNEQLAKASALQGDIWRQAVAVVRTEGAPPQAAVLVLPALNAMIDITTTRTMAAQLHPPGVVYFMLFALPLACALLAGYGMVGKSRSWLHILCFAFVIAVIVYVTTDIEYPRLGFIRVDAFDQALVDLRNNMK
jgi:hypothetical protein